MTGLIQLVPDGIRLRLKVTPKARRTAIGEIMADADGAPVLKIAVTAAPEDGKANAAVIALLAKEWGVAKTAISVVTGATDRHKLVEIRGQSEELAARIAGWLDHHH
ncbi:DUF167 domain-containing protein [Dongia soli]|uniref:UPF0235 protein SMD27_04705 n=1 Tax=Dongia soli TaxID=600628 RepID=A0ABU5E740_9PROT|nr:DUF167 domain-containing protein [Dongia soli]MDY0882132.1 DUF167 domain-containing protein [Dongia soli]